MDRVSRLPDAERQELFSETAAKMDLAPGLIEKDFWVVLYEQPLVLPQFMHL
jgi:hypothetical protein